MVSAGAGNSSLLQSHAEQADAGRKHPMYIIRKVQQGSIFTLEILLLPSLYDQDHNLALLG